VSAALLPHPLAQVADLVLVPIGVYGFYARFGACPRRFCAGPLRLRASLWWVLWATSYGVDELEGDALS